MVAAGRPAVPRKAGSPKRRRATEGAAGAGAGHIEGDDPMALTLDAWEISKQRRVEEDRRRTAEDAKRRDEDRLRLREGTVGFVCAVRAI